MPSESPDLSSAMEDYLETIYHLEQAQRIARVRDIAKRLDVKMSSVTSALKSLGSRGFIQYDPHQFITLTAKGLDKAREIVRKHEVLKRFFVKVLRIEGAAAEDNACRIEHYLDPEVIEKFVRFVEFVEMCPVDQTRWLESLSEGCDNCFTCLDEASRLLEARAEVQKAAMEDGLTLADAATGSQVLIDTVKGSSKARKALEEHGLGSGVIVQIESRDAEGNLQLNIKGYHVGLEKKDANRVLVKPI
jgi:DtxR family Mn-dependent transcriptional regulator